MSEKENIQALFQKYIDGTINKSELEQLARYMEATNYSESGWEVLKSYYEDDVRIRDDIWIRADQIADRSWMDLSSHINQENVAGKRLPRIWIYGSIAAAILLTICGIWYHQHSVQTISMSVNVSSDIHPGTNRAILTLDNGKSALLNEGQEAVIVDNTGVHYADGTVIVATENVQMARIATPRAGQYQIVLPDGSKVWLNAESTLRYPTRFTGDTRRVELDGEAYFEVKSRLVTPDGKIKQPFIVSTAGQDVEVLGTQFNIMAYTTEKETETTLVEGKVKLSRTATAKEASISDNASVVLTPGQQGLTDRSAIHVRLVDVEQYTAWKDGLLVLEHQTVDQVLRQIERWYDVTFEVTPGMQLPSKTLSGEVLRNLPVSVLLKALEEQTQLHFEIKGRRIMVKS